MSIKSAESLKPPHLPIGTISSTAKKKAGKNLNDVNGKYNGHKFDDHDRLDQLAQEAAKKVCEFNALIADVESRSRNQQILLERLYENKPNESVSPVPEKSISRPTKLDLPTTTATGLVNSNGNGTTETHVDELDDFGPLSKKLKQNGPSPIASRRRNSEFSILSSSLPRTQLFSRTSSIPTPSGSPFSGRRFVQIPNNDDRSSSETTTLSTKVNNENNKSNNNVGGLVKLFSDTQAKVSTGAQCKATPLPPPGLPVPQRPAPSVSPPSSRLVVSGPDNTIICCEGLVVSGSMAAVNGNPAVSPETRNLNGRSSPSSFSNVFAFLREQCPKNIETTNAANTRLTSKPDGSQLERLLAGLNFSKFRITDRTGYGSQELKKPRSPSPRNGLAPSQQPVATAVNGARSPKLGQDENEAFGNAESGKTLRLLPLARTISQPTGLSNVHQNSHSSLQNSPCTTENPNCIPAVRKERLRVTLSEDRENILLSPPKQNGGAMLRVSEDIASLILDIRQHFQLYRRRDHLSTNSISTPNENSNSSNSAANTPFCNVATVVEEQFPNNSDDSCGSQCPETSGENRRDSDYVVSVVSDDYSESTGPVDETMDTESTSSSFIFSPTASNAGTNFRTVSVERECLVSGPIHPKELPPLSPKMEPLAAESAELPYTSAEVSVRKTSACVYADNSHKMLSNAGRSLTFPPQTRKNSVTICGATFSSTVTSCAWQMDNPENRLSSASFPESAASLTDSVYSTAGSSSLHSYMDHAETSSQSTQQSESESGLDTRKPRYHSDPTPSVTEFPEKGVALYSISEPVLPNGATSESLDTSNNSSEIIFPVSVPFTVKQDLIRESGGIMVDEREAWLVEHNVVASETIGTPGPTVVPQSPTAKKGFHHDNFRRSDKRLPRGPFGIRLEEDQMRRDRARQVVHDLSFLNSPEPSPGTPELVPIGDSDLRQCDSKVSSKMPRRRQSAQLLHADKMVRQYVNMKSSPDLFHNVNGTALVESGENNLRPGEICRSASDAEASNWKKNQEDVDSAVYSGSTESVPTSDASSLRPRSQSSNNRPADFRTHIVKELYDTEKSYVESLNILEKYFDTLRANEDIVDRTLAENMFYQVPAIKYHHESLQTELRKRMETWDAKQKIGDVIVQTFTQEAVIESYTAFINNWKTAKDAIKLAKMTRPNFVKFLEQCAKEHRGKLNLDALLIMPVQRIPRYELLIKELLKHTTEDHPDRITLEAAQNQVHELALKINAMEAEVEEAERMMIRLKELEMYIDGLNDLVEPNRKFLKFDMVTMASGNIGLKKDRCLFLFSDLLVITNLKRKSGTIRKPSSNSCSPQLYPTLENNKYKLLMKISLEDLELAKPVNSLAKKIFVERDQLETDLNVLSKISDLTGNLSATHQALDDAVRNMMAVVSRQLSERQAHAQDPNLTKLELTVPTQHGLENVSINYLSVGKRNAWERAFLDAKQALGLTHDRRPPPDFVTSIPIRKTRAGMQITCSAATSDLNAHDSRDVWVCNSDGYVGQICVLNMQPEPALASCITASTCKITCICSVPAASGQHKGSIIISSRNTSPISDHSGSGDLLNPSGLNLVMESDDEESDDDLSVEDHSRSLPASDRDFILMSEDELSSTKPGLSAPDATQGTMWIGTEDGCILVYYCNDNIRIRKPRLKLQHTSAIQCIAYTEHTVFVGLSNGQIAMYSRTGSGFWETNHPFLLQLGSAVAPVQKMTLACGKMWCACLNMIHVVNLTTLKVETTFPAGSDSSKPVGNIVCSGLGVWISLNNSPVLKLCSAVSYEFLADINLTASVQKMLAGCDEILRQHKFATLRITALLSCKDLLWVGTSAGVILTISLPHIVPGMTKLQSTPTLTGIWHGHTGQVRFLHCVEQNPVGAFVPPSTSHRSGRRDRRMSVSAAGSPKMLVLSGGDGYEDFRTCGAPVSPASPSADGTGRDDSTNHLLLWQC